MMVMLTITKRVMMVAAGYGGDEARLTVEASAVDAIPSLHAMFTLLCLFLQGDLKRCSLRNHLAGSTAGGIYCKGALG